nr:MAG TPA: hypothetical protein [Caudoviricetes sp.]
MRSKSLYEDALLRCAVYILMYMTHNQERRKVVVHYLSKEV